MELKPLFKDIANAIREKDGTTADIVANKFPERIRGIPSGGIQLASITVTTAPDKIKYFVGEAFNPAGMVVTATFDNGATLQVNNSDLSFFPSGALAETDTAITISYTSGGVTVATQLQIIISISTVHVYGAQWDGAASTKWSRTDEAMYFTDPVPYVEGATTYSSPFDDLMPWSGMVKSERTVGTMVAIPKFWYKLEQVGNGLKIQIADEETEGFYTSPAHMDRGDGKGERDVVYVGRYHCGSDFKSNRGQVPKLNTTRASFRNSIHALGGNIWQMDFATRFTLWLLYLVEFADWNSQACIGYGCGNSSSTNMGYTDSMPYHTGTTRDNRDSSGYGTQYRNIEGLWDNCSDFIDGAYYDTNGLNIILNPNYFSDVSYGVSVGIPKSGIPSAFNVANQAGFPMIIPSDNRGGFETFTCDSWGFSQNSPVLWGGGGPVATENSGLFFINCKTIQIANSITGSRIMELPENSQEG